MTSKVASDVTVTDLVRTAVFSPCGVYRYELRRRWADGPLCGWIMLNPSTADAERDDPTVRRCMGFARAWGYAGIVVRNLYALRATNPRELMAHRHPVGDHNDDHLIDAVDDAITVCAWGSRGARGDAVFDALADAGANLHHLGLTRAGQPRHPLYLPGDLTPHPFGRPKKPRSACAATPSPHPSRATSSRRRRGHHRRRGDRSMTNGMTSKVTSDVTTGPTLRVLSLGAGVQSTTLALLACEGRLPTLDAAIFADTGWEPRAVLEHLARLEAELQRAGIPLYRVSRGNLRADVLNPNKHTNLPAFIRNPDGSMGKVRRHCTDRYKLRPIREQVRLLLGATLGEERECRYCEGTGQRVAPWRAKRGELVAGECSVCDGDGRISRVGPVPAGRWAEQWIGFSTDEIERVSDKEPAYTRARYPLLELGMSRQQCITWLARRGWGSTPKSACRGCPFHGNKMWRDLRDHDPDSWADAVDMDHRIRRGPGLVGEQYLHRSLLPLDQAPIDRIERKEWREAQGDLLDFAAELEDGEPDGCSPYGCRSGRRVPPRTTDADRHQRGVA